MKMPQSVINCLWSYDISKIDLKTHKQLIIFNVLNYGTMSAVNWLFENYSKQDIKQIIESSYLSAWNKKSLNYWKVLFNIDSVMKTKAQVLANH